VGGSWSADVDALAQTAPGHRGGCAADATAPPADAGGADADAGGYANAAAGVAGAADASADDDDGNNAAVMSLSLLQQLLHCG